VIFVRWYSLMTWFNTRTGIADSVNGTGRTSSREGEVESERVLDHILSIQPHMMSDRSAHRSRIARGFCFPRFRKGSLVRNVMLLACGTAGAQALTIVATPLLTRIFPPEAYGLLGLFVSIGSFLGLVGTLRYDQAIPLEPNNENASNLVALALAWSAIVAMLVLAGGGVTTLLRGSSGTFGFYELLPLTSVLLLAVAVQLVGGMWAAHRERFGRIAASEVVQAFSTLSIQLTAGLFGLGAVALIGGQLGGAVLGASLLAAFAWREGALAKLLDLNLSAKWQLARKHYRFPLYAMPAALLEQSSKQIPVFLLATFHSPLRPGTIGCAFACWSIPGVSSSKTFASPTISARSTCGREARIWRRCW
jgi:hypothetical protein